MSNQVQIDVQYTLTVSAFDVENVRKALRFIIDTPDCLERGCHGNGGGLGGEPWRWSIERLGQETNPSS